MADKKFAVLAHSPERLNVISTKLGAAKRENYTDKDIKKAVKMGTESNYVVCVAGDDLEGFIDNIDGGGTTGGFVFGGVAHPNSGFRVEVQVAAGQATPLVVRDRVVAADQLALGTEGLAQVQKGDGVLFVYRVIALLGDGTGAAGSTVLLEKV